ncbi:hypothetical protein N7495_007758 [Penicillium taxi]|uniref:uncharacterized protein n=1 Tax=Penicillium taxi TaxID=168475 RepID=UPI00254588D7|nr:uncharacterized protein N7495_007758 [Penicillium taxi]KAJ5887717.1 hypothetical protein N7495_007758 [Penicillium taxi]
MAAELDLGEEMEMEQGFLIDLIAGGGRNRLRTRYVLYSEDLPEYPATDVDGFAYIVHMARGSELMALRSVQSVQYAMKQKYRDRLSNTQSFLGVKLCEYAHRGLKYMSHSSVTPEDLRHIEQIQNGIPFLEDEKAKRAAYVRIPLYSEGFMWEPLER